MVPDGNLLQTRASVSRARSTSWGGTSWLMSTTSASGTRDSRRPFISPTYPSTVPKSVSSVKIGRIPTSPQQRERSVDRIGAQRNQVRIGMGHDVELESIRKGCGEQRRRGATIPERIRDSRAPEQRTSVQIRTSGHIVFS